MGLSQMFGEKLQTIVTDFFSSCIQESFGLEDSLDPTDETLQFAPDFPYFKPMHDH